MLGVVEEEPKKEERAAALASRIRFSDALLADGVTKDAALEAESVPLRILSSLKPPSPAMYFRPRQAPGWVAKVDLQPGIPGQPAGTDHIPQGRKVYVHHKVHESEAPWRTRHEEEHQSQKNRVWPIRRNQSFWFHVAFDNLTDEELGLLLYSLAPSESFHHKIGMGKSLGLGSLRLDVKGLFEVGREKRYSVEGLRTNRYGSAQLAPTADGVTWPQRYAAAARFGKETADFFKLREKIIASGLVTREIHQAIWTAGDFDHAPPSGRIHTPTVAGQNDPEVDTYQWFVANEDAHEFLRPLSEGLKPPADH